MTEPRDILSFRSHADDSVAETSAMPATRHGRAGERAEVGEANALRLHDGRESVRNVARAAPFAWQDLLAEPGPRPVQIRLGRAAMCESLSEAARHASIIPLDGGLDESVDVVVDGQLIGQGRMVIVQGKLAVEIMRVVESRRTRASA